MKSTSTLKRTQPTRWNHGLFRLPHPIGVTAGWMKGDYKIVHRPKRKARPYVLVTEQGKHVGDYETLELAKRYGDVRMEETPKTLELAKRYGDVRMEETPKTAEQNYRPFEGEIVPQRVDKTVTYFQHGCKDFQIDDDHTLSFTNQRGERVYIWSEGKGIDKLLDQAVSSYRGRRTKK